MQFLQQKNLIFLLILLLSGCAGKCPDGMSFHPAITHVQDEYDVDGFSFSVTWYLPIDPNNLCSQFKLIERKLKDARAARVQRK